MQSEIMQNMPNQSLSFTAFSTTFGNADFMLTAPKSGKVGSSFPTIPYLSLEALLYQQQMSNPIVSPVNVQSGSNVGEQVISGTTTSQDALGTSRYLQGYQASDNSGDS